MQHYDVIVVGAGPTGLACAIEAKRRDLSCLLIEKGCLVNSLYHYPVNMVFFTTPELLEIGDIPMVSVREKPTRIEALKYYRLVAQHFGLLIHQYEQVCQVEGEDGRFVVHSRRHDGSVGRYTSHKLIIATGYYDRPNMMGIPGEELPKVSHYYREAHPYSNCDVAVIGGRNSAAETALDLYRHGARVTLIHRSAKLSDRIKYWLRPDIENRIQNKEIHAQFDTRVVEIRPDSILVAPTHTTLEPGESDPSEHPEVQTIKNDFVFAMTGYHPDSDFLQRLGIAVEPRRMRPYCDPSTLESNVPGIYLGGVIIAGLDTNEIFIENGRFHGKQIVADIAAKLKK
ncbi:MAG: YpdA family putative bacillithiol disulfide reductase [Acidobacteria bacterium]|nr:YpdA family putative bacillithiol disulfide reductase [Acidobacteriota bacterium]